MNQKLSIALITVIGFVAAFYLQTKKENKKEPVTITAGVILRKLTVDDLIMESELIVIGEFKVILPNQWRVPNRKDLKGATPGEIFQAGGLFTDSLISIDQILKGYPDGPLVRVRAFVGETEQVRLINAIEPKYEKRPVYLLFLHKDTGLTGVVNPGD